jgi:hypothetical protein
LAAGDVAVEAADERELLALLVDVAARDDEPDPAAMLTAGVVPPVAVVAGACVAPAAREVPVAGAAESPVASVVVAGGVSVGTTPSVGTADSEVPTPSPSEGEGSAGSLVLGSGSDPVAEAEGVSEGVSDGVSDGAGADVDPGLAVEMPADPQKLRRVG